MIPVPFIPFAHFTYRGETVPDMEFWAREHGSRIALVRMRCQHGEYLTEIPSCLLSELRTSRDLELISERP